MTLDDLLSQTDDANVKRLILDAYKLGVADGYARDRVKPNYPERPFIQAVAKAAVEYTDKLIMADDEDGA